VELLDVEHDGDDVQFQPQTSRKVGGLLEQADGDAGTWDWVTC
jgi:hypothetical protein